MILMNDGLSKRGRYDRHSSREDRAAAERAALKRAVQELLAERGPAELSVALVCQRAAVGRNTLYAHYNGVEELLRETRQTCERSLGQALQQATQNARAPRSRLSGLCAAWLEYLAFSGEASVLVLTPDAQNDAVSRVLAQELAAWARQAYAAGLVSRPPEPKTRWQWRVGLFGRLRSAKQKE